MRRLAWYVVLLALVGSSTRSLAGQEVGEQLADRGPRFLLASAVTAKPTAVDAASVPVLRQRISVDLDDVTLEQALTAITRDAGLRLVYSKGVVPLESRVRLQASNITVAGALIEVLMGAGVDVMLTGKGQAVLVKRAPAGPVQLAPGSIAGRVTDKKAGTALAGATVVIEGSSRSATTGNDGRYRIADVAPGAYTLRARYIGYAPATASATVSEGQEVTADLALEKSAQRLDEVVTTGTVVPTEVKALPTPINVINEHDIANQRPYTIGALLRQVVPTSVSFNYPGFPDVSITTVRGASSLGSRGMKIFIDGIEAANSNQDPIDPNSVERIEVLRGPQAAAIYGPDAIGGVIQIFTKRGDLGLARPQVNAEAAYGIIQTPYAGFDGVLRQKYTTSVRGGGPEVSYDFGGGYEHTANWIPNGELSAQSNPSFYGGMRFTRGILSADLSARYYVQNNPQVANPYLSQTGYPYYSQPFYLAIQNQNQTLGGRVSIAPTRWWQQTLTVGIDRYGTEAQQTRARLTTPDDTLLSVSYGTQTKTAIGYNTTVQGTLGADLSGSLTAGFDHYSLPVTDWSTSGALNTAGTIQTAPDQPVTADRSVTTNTGYFAQLQLGFRDALFLTAGLRADHNSNFGDSLGTPVSPRVGLSYAQPLGTATLKLRGSYGRAIRAPSPGQKFEQVAPGVVVLGNPALGPERQQGWDAGVDAVFGSRGSLSVTYYSQTAKDLIQEVFLTVSPLATFQYQNVGVVKNTGVEVEGSLSLGAVRLRGQYGYARAKVDQLAPTYTGNLRVGDQTLQTPRHTAGASITVSPFRRTTLAAGLIYVGSYNAVDIVAELRCFAGTGPCPSTTRGYIAPFPSFVKLNATVSQEITRFASGFISVDNLTNNESFEASSNFLPVMGRISTVGLRLHY